ncbi:MAG TPA: flagellar export chaperone FlgN [Gemmatimonadaceae bacterium]|nr:flagellar export chaperone FlgN [Gemmatimonadaceae bacterium]
MTTSGLATSPTGLAEPTAAATAILDVLATERRLVADLTAIVGHQRDAIGADDLEAVDRTSNAMQRVLFTLNEARSRRRSIARILGAGDVAIGDIEDLLGDRMNDAIRVARDDLRTAARRLSDEIAINRRVLRSALATNDAYAARLTGACSAATYRDGAPPVAGRSGVLLNRRG